MCNSHVQGLLSTSPQGHSHGGHHHGIDMDRPMLALSMTILSISVKEGLYWITKQSGERQGSRLMKANAWHHRVDVISSVVALVGVGGSILGVKFLDPLAGLVVSGMILKAGLESGYQSVLELVDAAIPEQELDLIKQTILRVEGVKKMKVEQIRRHILQGKILLEIEVSMPQDILIREAMELAEAAEKEILKAASDYVIQASIQLRLGQPINKFDHK